MIIRRAVERDVPQVCAIHKAAARELSSASYTAEQIEAWVGALTPESYADVITRHQFVVAEEERGIIGFAQLDLAKGEVDAVYVLPDAARRGVGTALLDALESIAIDSGVPALHLLATLNAIPFYEKAGYISECSVEYRTRGGLNLPVVSMSKQLPIHAGAR